jgi:hypothetical protein
MESLNMDQLKVSEVVEKVAGARDVLRPQGIDSVARWSLNNAAAAATVETEELRAKMNYRMRRLARQPKTERVDMAEVGLV